jgi:hypothetical protein
MSSTTSSSQFKGTIGRTWDESKPWWPQPIRAPADAPDILYIIDSFIIISLRGISL